nr:MAG TPA: hypothetical protein [Caudoviricetes sp.]
MGVKHLAYLTRTKFLLSIYQAEIEYRHTPWTRAV